MRIFVEVQKDTFEMQNVSQMTADVTAVAGKLSYEFSLKRRNFINTSLRPDYRSQCSPANNPTELLCSDDLSKHVKDITITNK